MWGSSFLFIEEGLEAFAPAVVTSARLLLGFATLVVFKAARRPLEREDFPRAFLGRSLFLMAIPLALFPIAQQWIDSSVAGMINGSIPVFAVIVARLMSRTVPAVSQVVGIATGLAGRPISSLLPLGKPPLASHTRAEAPSGEGRRLLRKLAERGA